jgi:O-acetyl-ADP-ribose deacetylase (regulator of RNase III)
MQIYLVAIHSDLADAWERAFSGVEEVTIKRTSIFDLKADAIVSPANSFGFMNGGIDFSISKNLGWNIEKRLQKRIREEFFGELLVGQATVVETDQENFPYLISAPTMRTPVTLRRTPNVYLAMKAILTLVKYGKTETGDKLSTVIKTIAIPGLGTGVGQVLPKVCAMQMRIAWEDVMKEKFKTEKGWEELRSNYAYLFTNDERDLKYDIP